MGKGEPAGSIRLSSFGPGILKIKEKERGISFMERKSVSFRLFYAMSADSIQIEDRKYCYDVTISYKEPYKAPAEIVYAYFVKEEDHFRPEKYDILPIASMQDGKPIRYQGIGLEVEGKVRFFSMRYYIQTLLFGLESQGYGTSTIDQMVITTPDGRLNFSKSDFFQGENEEIIFPAELIYESSDQKQRVTGKGKFFFPQNHRNEIKDTSQDSEKGSDFLDCCAFTSGITDSYYAIHFEGQDHQGNEILVQMSECMMIHDLTDRLCDREECPDCYMKPENSSRPRKMKAMPTCPTLFGRIQVGTEERLGTFYYYKDGEHGGLRSQYVIIKSFDEVRRLEIGDIHRTFYRNDQTDIQCKYLETPEGGYIQVHQGVVIGYTDEEDTVSFAKDEMIAVNADKIYYNFEEADLEASARFVRSFKEEVLEKIIHPSVVVIGEYVCDKGDGEEGTYVVPLSDQKEFALRMTLHRKDRNSSGNKVSGFGRIEMAGNAIMVNQDEESLEITLGKELEKSQISYRNRKSVFVNDFSFYLDYCNLDKEKYIHLDKELLPLKNASAIKSKIHEFYECRKQVEIFAQAIFKVVHDPAKQALLRRNQSFTADRIEPDTICSILFPAPEVSNMDVAEVVCQEYLKFNETGKVPNFAIMGGPGTGKTKIMARLTMLFGSKKVKDKVAEYSYYDLKGTHPGETQRRVYELLKQASEKQQILLIDGAYRFMEDASGKEALEMLVPVILGERTVIKPSYSGTAAESEENYDLSTTGVPPVWFTGYEKETRQMLVANPGLYRRISKLTLEIPGVEDLYHYLLRITEENDVRSVYEANEKAVIEYFEWAAHPEYVEYFANYAGVEEFHEVMTVYIQAEKAKKYKQSASMEERYAELLTRVITSKKKEMEKQAGAMKAE